MFKGHWLELQVIVIQKTDIWGQNKRTLSADKRSEWVTTFTQKSAEHTALICPSHATAAHCSVPEGERDFFFALARMCTCTWSEHKHTNTCVYVDACVGGVCVCYWITFLSSPSVNTRLVTELIVSPPLPSSLLMQVYLCSVAAATIVACGNISVIYLSVTSPSLVELEGVITKHK